MSRNLIGIAAVVTLAACSGNPKNPDNTAALSNDMGMNSMASNSMASVAPNAMMAGTADAPTDAPSYLVKAGAGDLFEIESSKAVLAKTGTAEVKAFAQMMIDHHTKSTEKLKAAARTDGVAVSPPTLDPQQQAMLDEIKAASPVTVDAVYKADQAKAHAAALTLHQGYAAGGDKPALRKAAGEIVPVVQKHIEALAKLPG